MTYTITIQTESPYTVTSTAGDVYSITVPDGATYSAVVNYDFGPFVASAQAAATAASGSADAAAASAVAADASADAAAASAVAADASADAAAASAADAVTTLSSSLLKANNLSDVVSADTSLTNLGATATGKAVITAVDQAAGRTAIAAAPLASPTFTGIPAAPTAAPATNTTQIATTAFVIANGPPSQLQATWDAGTDTTESTITAAKLSGAITALTPTPPDPTTTQVLNATAGATAGAVGTYAFMERTGNNAAIDFGDTIAGSSLTFAGVDRTSAAAMDINSSATAPSGTWMCLGYIPAIADATSERATIFLRIS